MWFPIIELPPPEGSPLVEYPTPPSWGTLKSVHMHRNGMPSGSDRQAQPPLGSNENPSDGGPSRWSVADTKEPYYLEGADTAAWSNSRLNYGSFGLGPNGFGSFGPGSSLGFKKRRIDSSNPNAHLGAENNVFLEHCRTVRKVHALQLARQNVVSPDLDLGIPIHPHEAAAERRAIYTGPVAADQNRSLPPEDLAFYKALMWYLLSTTDAEFRLLASSTTWRITAPKVFLKHIFTLSDFTPMF
ncbi:hypothetical protein TWF696_008536 [Orbilia brochopaga]|uniref:Uncharacterized protein n=1 Tax=Orbilia brochopaga TaxID=3140254 RepID=A0AAV9ULT4_9PEZI